MSVVMSGNRNVKQNIGFYPLLLCIDPQTFNVKRINGDKNDTQQSLTLVI